MSQEIVERILGRILTDAGFRQRFFARPQEQLRHFDLLEHERDSLLHLDQVQLLAELFWEKLDPRIVRG